MTNGEICKAIKAHKGRVYACINACGGQYHLELKKGEAYNTFFNYGLTEGKDFESGVEAVERSGDLYIDTVVED